MLIIRKYRTPLAIALMLGVSALMVTDSRGVTASNDSTKAVFDVVISLYSDPQGDDKYPDDGSTATPVVDDSAQKKYEAIIEHFADAVCEQTNGVHHVGQVTFHRKAKVKNPDIKWIQSCHPSTQPGGFTSKLSSIKMCDKFGSQDYLVDAVKGGYVIGHEWGHYALGLFDEYKGSGSATSANYVPRSNDTAVTNSAMHRARNAKGGNYKWLNHSTSDNIGTLTRTAQGRVFGKSGWDTLVETTLNDPKATFLVFKTTRTRYTNLATAKPKATDTVPWFKIELPTGQADCRKDLKIKWVSGKEMQLIIDKSGSMSGAAIANAKTAARNMVDIVPGGETALGVVAFNSSASQVHAVTAIADPGTAERTAIKGSINGISAGGGTNMYVGLNVALGSLNTFATANKTNASRVVFLLSDGISSTGSAAAATAAYVAAKIPVMTFGYGSFASGSQLQAISNATGGQFFASPTSLAQIKAAFVAASAAVLNTTVPAQGVSAVAGGGTNTDDFIVDSTLSQFVATAVYTGSLADMTFDVLGPNGASLGIFPSCERPGSESSCTITVDAAAVTAAGTGTYSLQATNNTAAEVAVSFFVTATPKDGFSYDLTVTSLAGVNVAYPAPMVIAAALSKEWNVTGVDVTAEITKPDSSKEALMLKDDGADGDFLADDGIYSGLYMYTLNGAHVVKVNMSNNSSTAAFTTEGSLKALGPVVALPAIVQNFTRVATTQFAAAGVVADDHQNDPTTGTACTAIVADNSETGGVIEVAGDVDCFRIATVDVTKDLVVRFSDQAFGMMSKVTVYRNDGTTVITTFTIATQPTGAKVIAAADLDAAGIMITVEHEVPAAAGGAYSISAGDAIPGDVAVAAPPPPPPAGGGGSAIGPFSLIIILGLAIFGIRRRRFI